MRTDQLFTARRVGAKLGMYHHSERGYSAALDRLITSCYLDTAILQQSRWKEWKGWSGGGLGAPKCGTPWTRPIQIYAMDLGLEGT